MTGRRPSFGRLLRVLRGGAVVTSAGERAQSLYSQPVGRTDFPKGSMSKLIRSIEEKLLVLPNDTKVLPGHGEWTTIGKERQYNPFL